MRQIICGHDSITNTFELSEILIVNYLTVGCYALFDAGAPLTFQKLLTPYRSVRYHLAEWGGHLPSDSKELFNLRQSTKRSRAEIGIGLLKGRFPELRYGIVADDIQEVNMITQAIGLLHNYIQDRHGARASIIDLWSSVKVNDECGRRGILTSTINDEQPPAASSAPNVPSTATAWRDVMAETAWIQYQNYLEAHPIQEEPSNLLTASETQAIAGLTSNYPGPDFFVRGS